MLRLAVRLTRLDGMNNNYIRESLGIWEVQKHEKVYALPNSLGRLYNAKARQLKIEEKVKR